MQVDTLERFPQRCGYARERLYIAEELRQLLFRVIGSYLLWNEPELTVYVLYVRHGRRRAIGEPASIEEEA